MQKELPLDIDLISLMQQKRQPIMWRRAHQRTSKSGVKFDVNLTIRNSDGGEMEGMLLRQLPKEARNPRAHSKKKQDPLEL